MEADQATREMRILASLSKDGSLASLLTKSKLHSIGITFASKISFPEFFYIIDSGPGRIYQLFKDIYALQQLHILGWAIEKECPKAVTVIQSHKPNDPLLQDCFVDVIQELFRFPVIHGKEDEDAAEETRNMVFGKRLEELIDSDHVTHFLKIVEIGTEGAISIAEKFLDTYKTTVTHPGGASVVAVCVVTIIVALEIAPILPKLLMGKGSHYIALTFESDSHSIDWFNELKKKVQLQCPGCSLELVLGDMSEALIQWIQFTLPSYSQDIIESCVKDILTKFDVISKGLDEVQVSGTEFPDCEAERKAILELVENEEFMRKFTTNLEAITVYPGLEDIRKEWHSITGAFEKAFSQGILKLVGEAIKMKAPLAKNLLQQDQLLNGLFFFTDDPIGEKERDQCLRRHYHNDEDSVKRWYLHAFRANKELRWERSQTKMSCSQELEALSRVAQNSDFQSALMANLKGIKNFPGLEPLLNDWEQSLTSTFEKARTLNILKLIGDAFEKKAPLVKGMLNHRVKHLFFFGSSEERRIFLTHYFQNDPDGQIIFYLRYLAETHSLQHLILNSSTYQNIQDFIKTRDSQQFDKWTFPNPTKSDALSLLFLNAFAFEKLNILGEAIESCVPVAKDCILESDVGYCFFPGLEKDMTSAR